MEIKEEKIVTIEEITQKILTTDKQYDLSKILSAYEFAKAMHGDQMRSSGVPYITHPLAVADILLELSMDTDTICAALLHDTVEDTEATYEDLQKRFGRDVAMLVDGVTKIDKTPIFNKEQQLAENVRKIMLAMNQDTRVIIIKLCDRVHNMRTLCYCPSHKQRKKALETMDIYAPIADRLGIRAVKEELEDLAFQYLDPYAYAEIEQFMDMKKTAREQFIASIQSQIGTKLQGYLFSQTPQIEGRVKSAYGIYKKVFVGHKDIEQVYDKYAVRVIVNNVPECYTVLGVVHEMYRPIPNRFKDYISTPKANNYQSLHTTVLGSEGIPFEVQIRTWDMHATAEYGIAAHWKYKVGMQGKDKMDQRLAWVRQFLEAQQSSDDITELVQSIKNDLAPEDIYVMTPKGDTINLPKGATVIDYAYRIHTDVGHKTMGAKVGGKIVPLDYQLKTGEICEILTSKDPEKGPTRAWLEIVKTNDAKSKIRSWFKRECREENIITGKSILEKEFKRNRMNIPEEDLESFLKEDMHRHNCNSLDDLYASIGYGGIMLPNLIARWKDIYQRTYCIDDQIPTEPPLVTPIVRGKKSAVILDEITDCAVKFAQCCNPLPGDDIVGFITRGHGISVHTMACINYRSMLGRGIPEEKDRWMEVQWTDTAETAMQTGIEVIASDRVGLVFDITAILTEARIPILHSSSRNLKNGNAIFEATIKIVNKSQLTSVFDRLRHIKGVLSVERGSN